MDREIYFETLRELARTRWRWVLAAVMTILALAVTLEEIHEGATLFLNAAPAAQWALGAAALGRRAWDPQGLSGSTSAGFVSPARFVIARWLALVSGPYWWSLQEVLNGSSAPHWEHECLSTHLGCLW